MASNSSSAASAQVAVAIALQSVNTKEALNANCVNERFKILRSLNRVFVFEIVLCIGAPCKDPARFVDFGFWISRNKEAQEYKSSSQETNHNKSPPSDAAAEVRAAKVTIEATKRDVAAMSADFKAAVAAGELLRGTKASLEGLLVEVRSARNGGAQHTKDIIEITETARSVNETATLAMQGAEQATAAIDKITREAAATRKTAIINSKSIYPTRRDVGAAWSDIASLRDDVKKIQAAAEVSLQSIQRLRRDTDANVKTANSDAKAASQRAATAQGAADEPRRTQLPCAGSCRQPRPRSRPTPRQSRRPNRKRQKHGSKPWQRGTPSRSSSSGSPPSSRRTSGGTTRCNGRPTQPKQRNRLRPRGLGLSFRQFIAPRTIGKPPSP